ncbi:MAG: SUMF1/EgtB/PvdO family nonheme iron enzyme [Opitutaceae bacterium]|nr:SUMF1/EgtB/PvdO family nonheme iron enzyme [Opitutaceae bacterium]
MPYQRRRRTRYVIWGKLRLFVLILMGLAALAGLWWWLTQLGPRAVTVAVADEPRSGANGDSEVAALQKQLTDLRQAIAAEGASVDIVLLDEAVEKQRGLIEKLGARANQAEVRKLSELEGDRDSAVAVRTNQRIQKLDTEAMKSRDAGEIVTAEANWTEALRLQQQVNRSTATSALKNFVREGRFEQQRQELFAIPLAAEIAEAMSVSREAMDTEEWAEALAGLSTARELQLQLNVEFPRSRHAGLATLGEIERKIEALDAAGVAARVDEQEEAGDLAMTEQRFEEAVLAYEEARQTQLRLNREFNRSRFLSSPRVEQLEVRRQTASSVPLLAALRQEVDLIEGFLRRRETAIAATRIAEVAKRLEAVFEQLPKSEKLDPSMRLQLGFLDAQRDRLGDIQDAVYDRLRPLPGVSELQLFRTELPQSIYLQVMRVNPSRNPGRAFPVDSVNWFEAMSFCERLGWVMGWPVRLPTEDEFRVAVGEALRIDLRSGGETERTKSEEMASLAPNRAGFFDLLGNVAEWLAPRADQTGAWSVVAGGSFLDGSEVLRKVPSEVTQRSERARHIGFRVLVEIPAP